MANSFKIIEDEEEYKKVKLQLMEKVSREWDEKTANLTSYEINWVDDLKNYEAVKIRNYNLISNQDRMLLLAHNNDVIRGKPQLVHQVIQRIPMLRKVEKKWLDKETNTWRSSIKYKFIDDSFDKRYDGNDIETLTFDFWIYRIIDKGKEYYLFSTNKLKEEFSDFKGMKISLSDLSDLNTSLRIKKITTIFLVKESNPFIKVLNQQDLIEFSRDLNEKYGWDIKGFQNFVFSHPDGKVYDYSDDFNNIRIAQLLSGKYEGYPLHLMKIGPVGTGKTTEAEVLDYKFKEEQGILEAGSSRVKVLVPSFKEKPANLGYICNCNRIAIIDELMKMIMAINIDSHQIVSTYLGELNMLLEHKDRLVGSGNDNTLRVKATAKVCITTNPLPNKNTLAQHLSVIDGTTLSRMLLWVQDREETDIIYSKSNIRTYNSPEHTPETSPTFAYYRTPTQALNHTVLSKDCVRGNQFDDFLTIYDSCQQFLAEIDFEKAKTIFESSLKYTKEPLKQIWRSRGLHHTILILDGLIKQRCLFRDYDPNFYPLQEDYDNLNKILLHMISSWETQLNNESWKTF